jgi:hypothetical protein
MEYHRKQAKALVRAQRAGDPEAIRRAEVVLGARAHERFLLSDAQHVVAREQGFRTWHELRSAVGVERAWIDGEDVVLPTGLTYGASGPAEVVVRKRGWRFDLSDGGRAVELAGRPKNWRSVAENVVDEYRLNVNRSGVVFVQSTEGRLESLVAGVAECSVAVYEALLESELGSR